MNTSIALFFAAIAGVLGVYLDNHDAEREPTAATEARVLAQQEFRRDMAAAKLCRESHGPSLVRWTADGELVCVPLGKVAAL